MPTDDPLPETATEPDKGAFTIAIVGRPNVGKSTLFNRLVGKRLAIVDDAPGVTRDRREGDGRLADLEFTLIDTAGLEEASAASLEGRMRKQTETALDDADVAVMLYDARAGVTTADEELAAWLRTRGEPVILMANKCEGQAGQPGLIEGYALGLGDPLPFSAEHGEGLGALYDAIQPYFPDPHATPLPGASGSTSDMPGNDGDDDTSPLSIAVLGRPNVGKSTLINRLIGEERLLTGPEAGITRDAITIPWTHGGRAMRLVDTAGLRRRSKVTDKVEGLSARDTLRALRFAQVAVLILDPTDGLERQDLTIAKRIIEEGRALVIAVNKWDTVKDRKAALAHLDYKLETSLPQVKGVPIVLLSALTGKGLERLPAAVADAYTVWNRRVPTAALNRWLADMTEAHPPPMGGGGRRVRLRYMTQAKTRPPTFVIFSGRADEIPESYRRYLIGGLRDAFDMPGTPIRLILKKGKNPYAEG